MKPKGRFERVIGRFHWWVRPAVFVAVAALPVTVLVQSSPEPSRGGGWSTVMGDLGNRYSTLEQINLQNVSRLGAAWVSERLTPPANSRSMTVVRNGMMYFTAPPNVMKLNARTGQVAWRFAAGGGGGRGGSASAPPAMGAPDREGVALGDGLVFIGTSDARVVALRDDTGELVWNRYVGEDARDKGQGIAGAPVYAGGIVSVGLSGDNGWRGQVVGLDGKTAARSGGGLPCLRPASRGVRHGQRPRNGNSAAAHCGSPAWRMKKPAWSITSPATVCRSSPVSIARATTCSSARSSPST